MENGLSHFFYEKNPLIKAKSWTSGMDDAFAIYESSDNHGHVFYRKLKRGEIEGIPVILVINKPYQSIEKKINKDRDRNAFGEEVMRLFYDHFTLYGLKYSHSGQQIIVKAGKSCWEKGHPLLSEIADSMRYGWSSNMVNEVFGDGYYARSNSNHHDPATLLEINQLERIWQGEGKVSLPGYFRKFGVKNAEEQIRQTREKALEESKKNNRRNPTKNEQEAITLLTTALGELAPEICAVFNKGSTSYTVAQTDIVLGQLKSGRSYRSREVFLSERVFVGEFPSSLAIFLHEHAHIFGYDGSRG